MTEFISERAAVRVLEDWRGSHVDPTLKRHGEQIGDLLKFRDATEGKFAVIMWVTGITMTLVIGLIIGLFGWALTHVTFTVKTEPMAHSQSAPVQTTNDFGSNP